MSATALDASGAADDAVLRAVVWPSRFLTLALAIVFALGAEIPGWLQYLPLAASLILFGLPHGAVDHLVVSRLARRWSMAAIVVGYLALAGAYLAVWLVAPVLAFVLFIALTWYHWGQGDLATLVSVTPAGYLRTRVQRGLALMVRGGLPMLVPLLAAPDTYREVADASVGLFRADGASAISWAFDGPARLAAGVAFTILVVVSVAVAWPGPDPALRRQWATYTAETVLLAAYFVVVPPVLAIGIYFCCWHSTRHIARIIETSQEPGTDSGRRRPGPALRWFAREASLPTAGALILLAILAIAVPRPPGGPLAFTGLYLVGLALLTFPHTLVVSWMDLRQGVWRRWTDGRPGPT